MTRATPAGSHQFQRPASNIRLGISRPRTTVASSRTPSANPAPAPAGRPRARPRGAEGADHYYRRHAHHPPVRDKPSATATAVVNPLSQASLMRVTKKTS